MIDRKEMSNTRRETFWSMLYSTTYPKRGGVQVVTWV